MTMTTDLDFAIAPRVTHVSEQAPALSIDGMDMALLERREWDRIVSEFDGVCQEMTEIFARSRWPDVALEPVVFSKQGKVVAGALAMLQPLPLKLGHIVVIKWGPALVDEGAADANEIYAGAIALLQAEYAQRRGMMLSVMPRASLTQPNPYRIALKDAGFRNNSELMFPNRYIVNLRLDDETQRKSLAQKWRYHLKKSEKADLRFEHAGFEKFAEFDRLYEIMTSRKRFPDHSAYDTVHKLFDTDVEALKPELFFVYEGDEVVAGAIIFKAGNTSVYLYGATNERALPLRAGYFMHWHIIRWLRDNTQSDWYDLGGTDGFAGLHQFKKGMVGDHGVISPVPPIANYAASPQMWVLGTLAYFARDMAQRLQHLHERWDASMAKPDQSR